MAESLEQQRRGDWPPQDRDKFPRDCRRAQQNEEPAVSTAESGPLFNNTPEGVVYTAYEDGTIDIWRGKIDDVEKYIPDHQVSKLRKLRIQFYSSDAVVDTNVIDERTGEVRKNIINERMGEIRSTLYSRGSAWLDNHRYMLSAHGSWYPIISRGPITENNSCALDCFLVVAKHAMDYGFLEEEREEKPYQEVLKGFERKAFLAVNDVWDELPKEEILANRLKFHEALVEEMNRLQRVGALRVEALRVQARGTPSPPKNGSREKKGNGGDDDLLVGEMMGILEVWKTCIQTSPFDKMHLRKRQFCHFCKKAKAMGEELNLQIVKLDDHGAAPVEDSTMAELLHFEFGKPHHSRLGRCTRAKCKEEFGLETRWSVHGGMPERLLVAPSSKHVDVRGATDNRLIFGYSTDGEEKLATYRWAASVCLRDGHFRAYLNDCESYDEAGHPAGCVRVYDGRVLNGLVVGGVPPAHPERRVPRWWTEGTALYVYVRVHEPGEQPEPRRLRAKNSAPGVGDPYRESLYPPGESDESDGGSLDKPQPHPDHGMKKPPSPIGPLTAASRQQQQQGQGSKTGDKAGKAAGKGAAGNKRGNDAPADDAGPARKRRRPASSAHMLFTPTSEDAYADADAIAPSHEAFTDGALAFPTPSPESNRMKRKRGVEARLKTPAAPQTPGTTTLTMPDPALETATTKAHVPGTKTLQWQRQWHGSVPELDSEQELPPGPKKGLQRRHFSAPLDSSDGERWRGARDSTEPDSEIELWEDAPWKRRCVGPDGKDCIVDPTKGYTEARFAKTEPAAKRLRGVLKNGRRGTQWGSKTQRQQTVA